MENFNEFLIWEQSSRDTIDLKKIYIDITGDLVSGLLLSQIIYWHLPDKSGRTKLRVYKHDKYWLAKQRTDWWEEIRITAKQYDRAIDKLQKLGIVELWNTMFNAKNTPHIYLCRERLMELINEQMKAQETPRFLPLGKTDIPKTSIPITETTTKTNNKVNKGASKKSSALKFSDYLTQYPEKLNNAEIIEAIEYYLNKYEDYTGNDHPNLKPDQWQKVADNILIFDRETRIEDITLEQIEPVIDRHFITEYENCDYNILHFVSGDIIRNRVYEEGNY